MRFRGPRKRTTEVAYNNTRLDENQLDAEITIEYILLNGHT